jgi:hypothetical protein
MRHQTSNIRNVITLHIDEVLICGALGRSFARLRKAQAREPMTVKGEGRADCPPFACPAGA